MEEQVFQKIRDCTSLNHLSSTDSKGEISRLLSFFLDEINDTNDDTVQQLQQQIVDMSRLRDEQEEKMKQDREVIERWKGLVGKLGAKCRLLKMELKETLRIKKLVLLSAIVRCKAKLQRTRKG